uniref:Nucleotid_trans domain-containing protein n=1 Tax=Rhabditophanes sp. KR3021 TaxID=114890 RepID=A0AC35TP21_9BILA
MRSKILIIGVIASYLFLGLVIVYVSKGSDPIVSLSPQIIEIANFVKSASSKLKQIDVNAVANKTDFIYAIITVVDHTNRDLYKFASDTIKCYTVAYNYRFVSIAMDEELDIGLSCPHTDFMFRRHCFLSEYLNNHREIDYALFLDADAVIINPYLTLDKFIPRGNENVLLYERMFNYEYAAGSFMLKNTLYSRNFLKGLADYQFKLPNSMHGSDNAAIHAYVLETYAEKKYLEERKVCYSLWNISKDWNNIWDFEACMRYILNNLSEKNPDMFLYDDGRLGIVKKASPRRWIRDAFLAYYKWCKLDFIFHGLKGNISSMPQIPLTDFSFDEERCRSQPLPKSWIYKPEGMISCKERDIALDANNNRVAQEFFRDLNDSGYSAKYPVIV